MSDISDIAISIKKLADTKAPTDNVMYGKVLSVDEQKNTCVVSPINGDADLTDIRLIAETDKTGNINIPKEQSIVGVILESKDDGWVAFYSEIAKMKIECEDIEYNGGTNDGIVKINPLVEKINAIENKVNAFVQAFTTWIPIPGDGGAALKTLVASIAQITPITGKSDLEDTKIKH